MRLMLIPAALLLAAPGMAGQKRPVPDAVPAGKPVSCLSLTQVTQTRVRSDEVIDFYVGGGKVYRNTLPHKCPGLGFEGRYAHRTSLNEICSVDTITVLQSPGITPGASCGLGAFQPVTIADDPR